MIIITNKKKGYIAFESFLQREYHTIWCRKAQKGCPGKKKKKKKKRINGLKSEKKNPKLLCQDMYWGACDMRIGFFYLVAINFVVSGLGCL